MVVVVVVHHHHLHLDDFGHFAEFVVIRRALAEDRMALMMKILDNRQMVVSWLWCQTYVMDQHHNLTDAGRNHRRKGCVGMRCLMGFQIEDVNVQTFDPDPQATVRKRVRDDV